VGSPPVEFRNWISVVAFGDGAGGFHDVRSYHAGTGPGAVALADFNGDGNIDLFVADGSSVGYFSGLGNGLYGAGTDLVRFVEHGRNDDDWRLRR
jgi:hypothetical protein